MNERITKIVIDTLGKEGVVNSRAFGHWALSDEELEKFAELIVRECISTLEEKIHRSIDNEGDETWPDLILKEHFGVEE